MPKCNGNCFNCPYDDCILDDEDFDTDDTEELDQKLDLLNMVDSDKKKKQREWARKYYQQNREWILACCKQYRRKNKERISKRRKQYYQKKKKYFLARQKQYYQKNKKRIATYYKQYCQKNKERILAYEKRYRQKRKKENFKAWMVKYQEFLKNRRCNINVGKDEFE